MSKGTHSVIRLMLVDDHEVLRLGLKTLFSEAGGLKVVAEAGTVAAAVEQGRRLKPDLILMDVRLPDGSGVEACRDIRASSPGTRVLFLSSFGDDEAVLSTILAGADGFLLKEVSGDELIRAVRAVASGRSILDPGVTDRVLSKLKSLSASSGETKSELLAPQERRVLALVAEGKTNKEIAVALDLSEKTVGNYLTNIFQKLHVTRRSQAAVYFSKRFPT
ncbi:MAG TPA: response regulator transcription factor [Nitrospiraceae bacterium]|nr:response regulator transcription factor [Nitrospiraceae bacterium]